MGQNNPFIFNLHAIGGFRFKDKDTSVIADIKVIIAGVGDNLGNINDFSTGSVSAWSQSNGNRRSAKKENNHEIRIMLI